MQNAKRWSGETDKSRGSVLQSKGGVEQWTIENPTNHAHQKLKFDQHSKNYHVKTEELHCIIIIILTLKHDVEHSLLTVRAV